MSKRSVFTQADVTRAFLGAAKAGVHAAVIIHPDGTIRIVPVDRFGPDPAGDDLDDRIAKFGAS